MEEFPLFKGPFVAMDRAELTTEQVRDQMYLSILFLILGKILIISRVLSSMYVPFYFKSLRCPGIYIVLVNYQALISMFNLIVRTFLVNL